MKLFQLILITIFFNTLLLSGCKKDNSNDNNSKNQPQVVDTTKEFLDTRDNKIYGYVKIGNQIWMSQNLNYLTSKGSWCYNDSNKYSAKYGRLYDWYTATQSVAISKKHTTGICPQGWHLPEYFEWEYLINSLGGFNEAGGKLKEDGYSDWKYPNVNADNGSLFSALPGGFRRVSIYSNNIYFSDLGSSAKFWCTREYNNQYTPGAFSLNLDYDKKSVTLDYFEKGNGLSVRCIKNVNTNAISGTMTDSRDSKIYKTITIGYQTWMAENLNFQTASGSWYYNNDESKYGQYGRLYNWFTVMNGSSGSISTPSYVKGICPDGWHLPSIGEWDILIYAIGGYDQAGGKMKESGTSHWINPNIGTENSINFNALPSGFIENNGTNSNNFGSTAYFWTTTNNPTIDYSHVYVMELNNSGSDIKSLTNYYTNAYSVRCVKD